MSKRAWLTVLVCANVVLLATLVLMRQAPKAAYAQGAGLGGNYMAVTGEIGSKYDALYLIDVRERTFHAFVYDKGNQELRYSDYRELERDFRNK